MTTSPIFISMHWNLPTVRKVPFEKVQRKSFERFGYDYRCIELDMPPIPKKYSHNNPKDWWWWKWIEECHKLHAEIKTPIAFIDLDLICLKPFTFETSKVLVRQRKPKGAYPNVNTGIVFFGDYNEELEGFWQRWEKECERLSVIGPSAIKREGGIDQASIWNMRKDPCLEFTTDPAFNCLPSDWYTFPEEQIQLFHAKSDVYRHLFDKKPIYQVRNQYRKGIFMFLKHYEIITGEKWSATKIRK